MSIRIKLLGLISISIIFLSAIGIYSAVVYENALTAQRTISLQMQRHLEQSHEFKSQYRLQLNAWKNTLLRGEAHIHYHKYLQQYYSQERIAKKALTDLRKGLAQEKAVMGSLKELQTAHKEVGRAVRKAIRIFNETQINPIQMSDSFVSELENKPEILIVEIIDRLDKIQKEQLLALAEQRKSNQNALLISYALIVLIALVLGLLMIDRNIAQPADKSAYLASVMHDAQKIAKFGTWDWEPQANKSYWSDSLFDILELEKTVDCGLGVFIAALHTDDRHEVQTVILNAIDHQTSFETEARINSSDQDRVVQLRGKVSSDKGKSVKMTCIVYDISQFKASENRLSHLANFDTLTGLPNRHLFHDRLEHAMAQASRGHNKLALFFLDLDHFKAVNDALGHHIGDQLLIEAASRIKNVLRHSDTAARLGGDEFTIIIENYQDQDQLLSLTKKLLNTLGDAYILTNQEIFVSTSIGVTIYPDDGTDIDSLLKNADAAMYLAKEKGRNTYHFFTKELNRDANERLILENRLRKALDHDQYEVYYQPKMELKTGKVTGAEALLRWIPDHNIISPDRFIPILERTGMIKEVGHWVLDEACSTTKMWQKTLSEDFTMAVNLSIRQLRQAGIVEQVVQTLTKYQLDPRFLELELTESSLIDEAISQQNLKALAASGIKLSIDDFGTGYSSLSYLKAYSIDALKIDRSFIKDINIDINDDAVTSAIVALSHKLNMEVVAEGVETEDQLAFLRKIECNHAQGFYFAKPMTKSHFETWYQEYTEGNQQGIA